MSGLQGPRVDLTYRWVAQHAASCPLASVVGCVLPTCAQGLAVPNSRWLGEGENKWSSSWGLVLLLLIHVFVLLARIDIVDNYRTMFESRISAGATEKLPCSENLRISSWSFDMEGHAKKKCVERYCELSNKTTQQLHIVSTPCIDDHHFKEEEMTSVGELSHVCSQIVLKC